MAASTSNNAIKTVGAPTTAYETLLPLWRRSRAVCSGERYVKDLDSIVNMNNMLIPFSPSMTQDQYNFYLSEAELPGITAQFAKMIVGGLLRKQPVLTLPEDAPEGSYDWVINTFSQDDSPLTAFMDTALWDEVQTHQTWVHVDYPSVENPEGLTPDEKKEIQPYPVLWSAESVINWKVGQSTHGKTILERIIRRGY